MNAKTSLLNICFSQLFANCFHSAGSVSVQYQKPIGESLMSILIHCEECIIDQCLKHIEEVSVYFL